METNIGMPCERRGRQASIRSKPIRTLPASATIGEREPATGRASRQAQPTDRAPGRTNSNGAIRASRKAIRDAKPTEPVPSCTITGSDAESERSIPDAGTKELSSARTITGLTAGCDPTKAETKPSECLSDRTHSGSDAGAGLARLGTKPTNGMPDQQPIAGPAGGEQATCTSKPSSRTPARTSRAPGARRRGQQRVEAQRGDAAAAPLSPASTRSKPIRITPDSDQVGHQSRETQRCDADLIATIRALWRRRQAWHRAEKSLTLGIYAICRQFVGSQPGISELSKTKFNAKASEIKERATAGKLTDAEDDVAISVAPLLAARGQIEPMRLAIEKELGRLIKHLPATEWALAIPGIGAGSVFSIIGEAGDVGSYKSVSALWKRMGVAVISGERQRRKAGADGIEHGFAPERGAVSFNVGGGLIGRMGHGYRPIVGEDVGHLSEYQRLFVERCRYLAAREPEEYAREPVEKDGVLRESYSKHCANSARRFVVKRFYRHLFAVWRSECGEANGAAKPNIVPLPRTQFLEAAE